MKYTVNDFINYFLESGTHTHSEKWMRAVLATNFDGVDPDVIDLIVRKTKDRGIRYQEGSGTGGYFASFYHLVSFPVRDRLDARRTMFHELGHTVDFIYSEKITKDHSIRHAPHFCSGEVKLSCGKTLFEIVRAEVRANAPAMERFLRERFEAEVLNLLPDDTSARYVTYLDSNERIDAVRKEMRACKDVNSEEYKALLAEERRCFKLIEDIGGFNWISKNVYRSDCYLKFHSVYDIIEDMLSGVMPRERHLNGHSRSYMSRDSGFGTEFFADMFSVDVTGNTAAIEVARRFLPGSCAAYFELRDRIYSDSELAVPATA